jgi:hypothetical protein
MTLTPIIVAICVNSGTTYEEACKAALIQGANQSDVAKTFEQQTLKLEHQVISYIDPSPAMEVTASMLGYVTQLTLGNQAHISMPVHRDSSISFSVGKSSQILSLHIDF